MSYTVRITRQRIAMTTLAASTSANAAQSQPGSESATIAPRRPTSTARSTIAMSTAAMIVLTTGLSILRVFIAGFPFCPLAAPSRCRGVT